MQKYRGKWRLLAFWLVASGLLGLGSCVVSSPPPRAPQPGPADLRFNSITAQYFQQMLPLTPVAATALGEHRYDAMLDDVSAAGFTRRAQLAHQLLSQLQGIDLTQLTRPNQVDARLLLNELEYQIWSIEVLAEWRWNPLLYTDLAGNGIYLLMARDFAPLQQRLHDAGARLSELPHLLEQVRDSLDPARVPRIHAETALQQNAGILELIDQVVAPQVGALGEAEQTVLRTSIAQARTALAQHRIWLEKKLLPGAQGDYRLGAELYDAKLKFVLDSRLSRQEIRARAQSELTRSRAAMYAIATRVLAGRADAPPLPATPDPDAQQAAIVAALELAYAQHPQRDEVFETARRAFTETERFVRANDLVTLYDDPLEIIPMPEFERGVALAFCDSPGPLDRGQKTFYAVAPIPSDWNAGQVNSYLREYNTRSIYQLTIHEAMPGHYVQLMHANRYDSPLRAALSSGPFMEGWAVYAQHMMVEQGFLDHDPLMQLIGLKWDLRSIANALLDQELHVDGIEREAAMRLMMRDTFQEEREAAAKWVRAQLTAGQLPVYFVGAQEHLALREEARKAWGAAFTLKRYHDSVLSYGSPPVHYVRELMLNLPIE